MHWAQATGVMNVSSPPQNDRRPLPASSPAAALPAAAVDRTPSGFSAPGFAPGSPRWRGLASPRMRFVMRLALVLAFLQQITGINAVFYYLPTIFAQAGDGVSDAFRQAVIVGLVNVVMTVVAIWLIVKGAQPPGEN